MTTQSAIGIFSLCFILMTISSFVLGGSLEKLAARFHLSAGILGIIAALGADAPEISSAITALFVKQHDLGVGIIIGSNIFNLAALLGLSAVMAGRLPVRRQGILLNGATAFIVTLVLFLLIFRWVTPWAGVAILMLVLIPYVIISGLKSDQLKQWRLPEKVHRSLIVTIAHARHAQKGRLMVRRRPRSGIWWGGPAVIVIVVTSMGMVHSAVFLSSVWGVNKTILGVLILAVLTSIPNVLTSVKLALDGKGMAVISEAFNSNTINVLFGICVPAALLGVGALTGRSIFSAWWLLGTTVMAVLLLYFNKGFNRLIGAVILGQYAVFVAVMIGWK